jgi:hypothetical protein
LAEYFELLTPQPALVSLGAQLAGLIASIEPSKSALLRESIGLNFGSLHQKGVATWPAGKDVPESMRQTALPIFAFDALIYNDDRRVSNPNLFTRGDDFILFDHELAFSFLRLIGAPARPWDIENAQSLEQHVFYRALRKRMIDLSGFASRLAALGDRVLERFIAEVPEEWRDDTLGRILAHLTQMRENAAAFEEQVARRLAR